MKNKIKYLDYETHLKELKKINKSLDKFLVEVIVFNITASTWDK